MAVQKYPGWRVPKDGGPAVLVHNHEQEERVTGQKMNPDGTPVDYPVLDKPKPPTLEEVLAAGYSKEVAEKIVDEEAWKARNGYKPYGGLDMPVPVYPVLDSGGTPTVEEVKHDADPGTVQDPLAAGW